MKPATASEARSGYPLSQQNLQQHQSHAHSLLHIYLAGEKKEIK